MDKVCNAKSIAHFNFLEDIVRILPVIETLADNPTKIGLMLGTKLGDDIPVYPETFAYRWLDITIPRIRKVIIPRHPARNDAMVV